MKVGLNLWFDSGNGISMTHWSKDIAARVRQKAQDEKLSNAKALQDRQVLTDGRKAEWSKLTSALKNMTEQLNDEPDMKIRLQCSDAPGGLFVVTRLDSAANIQVRLDDSGEFNFLSQQSGYRKKINLELTTAGSGYYLRNSNTGAIIDGNMEQVAEEVITALL